MKSPTDSIRWLVTTCRGRESQLRAHLPNWLRMLPNWHPCIICCDDRPSFDFAAAELKLAGRGIALWLEQGPRFEKMEAIRAALSVIGSGIIPCGQACFAPVSLPQDDARNGDTVALWDVDTVALGRTARTLERVPASTVAVAQNLIRDDMGFLLCNSGLLRDAVKLIPVGTFSGWGPEDQGIRVAIWAIERKPFELIHPCWARQTHSDALRTAYQVEKLDDTASANQAAVFGLATRLLEAEQVARCLREIGWVDKFLTGKDGRRAS